MTLAGGQVGYIPAVYIYIVYIYIVVTINHSNATYDQHEQELRARPLTVTTHPLGVLQGWLSLCQLTSRSKLNEMEIRIWKFYGISCPRCFSTEFALQREWPIGKPLPTRLQVALIPVCVKRSQFCNLLLKLQHHSICPLISSSQASQAKATSTCRGGILWSII